MSSTTIQLQTPQDFVKSLSDDEKVEFFALLLQKLWSSSRSQGNSGWGQSSATISVEACKSHLQQSRSGYVDYFNGRVIKVSFTETGLDNYLYDRDIGFGAFNRVFNSVTSMFIKPTQEV
jgi:hypothetical protein